ncbi:MAG: DotA/TraY family protein [Albidovulum sp.]
MPALAPVAPTAPTASAWPRRGRRLALLAVFLPFLALAQDQAFAPERLRPTDTDVSVRLLRATVGSFVDRVRLADTVGAPDEGAFGGLFRAINSFVLLVLGLLVFVKCVAALLDTAHDGEALGRERSTVWTPARLALAVALLLPLSNGFAMAQVLVMWVTLSGVGLADAVWDVAVDRFSRAALYAEPPPAQARQLAVAMLASNVCEMMVDDIPAMGGTQYRVAFEAETTGVGTATERAVRYSVADLGEAACGGFAVREPAEGIRLQRGVSGVDWLDDFLRWVQELVGYGQETRELFVKELLAGHEIAALALRDELKPLARAIFESRAELGECVAAPAGPLVGGRCTSAIDVAAEHYATRLKGLIMATVDLAGQRAFAEFAATAKAEGWMTAGSWFYRFMALTDYMNKLALNVPQPYPVRVWEKLPKEVVETYAHLFKRLEAVVLEAETDAGAGLLRSSGDPENSAVDDLSHGVLRATLEWVIQAMMGKTHPLFAISWLGHALLAAVLAALAAAGAAGAAKTLATKSGAKRVADALGGLTDALTSGGEPSGGFSMVGMVLGVVFLALLGFALTAAIYLPLVPFIVWTVACLHWLVRVFEALVAAPGWALGFLRNGRGLTADAMPGWLALLSLLLTPALMVVGLLAATVISYALLTLVSGLFLTVSVNAMSGNVTGPVVAAGLLVVFVLFAVDLTVRCFALVHRLPAAALGWLGHHLEGAVEHHPLQHEIRSALSGPGGLRETGTTIATTAASRPAATETTAKVKPLGGGKTSE